MVVHASYIRFKTPESRTKQVDGPPLIGSHWIRTTMNIHTSK